MTSSVGGGQAGHRRWSLDLNYVINSKHELGSAILSPNFDETDDFVVSEKLPPLTELKLSSSQTLQVGPTIKDFSRLQAS